MNTLSSKIPPSGIAYSHIVPGAPSARIRWVESLRAARNRLDPRRAYAALWEEEADRDGTAISTATLFLTNTECPFRCVMCDLWRNTLDFPTPPGALPEQIAHALSDLPPARQIKLYNAGSFFDRRAVPPEDYETIAQMVSGFERVIVECHPAFLGDDTLRFQNMLSGKLEIAIGLETVHPGVLERLNKRMTVEGFHQAGDWLARHNMALRVFLLVRPPWLSEAEGVEWAKRSLEVAFDVGAEVCCVIPTRGGNGAMEALAEAGEFTPPRLVSLEAAQEYGLNLKRGRVYADLWDIEKFFDCACSQERAARLDAMNRAQIVPETLDCPRCTSNDTLAHSTSDSPSFSASGAEAAVDVPSPTATAP